MNEHKAYFIEQSAGSMYDYLRDAKWHGYCMDYGAPITRQEWATYDAWMNARMPRWDDLKCWDLRRLTFRWLARIMWRAERRVR